METLKEWFNWLTKERKYFKPKSVTWWASFVPLVAGVLLASGINLTWSAPLVNVVHALYGGAAPAILINAGAAGIGLRGAFK